MNLKKVKIKTLPGIKKYTWKLCSQYMLFKYPVCKICQKRYTEHTHHIIKRSISEYLYFDEKNLMPLCENCHNKLHADYRSRHVFEDTEIATILINTIGESGIDYLEAYRRKFKKWSRTELKELQEFYKAGIKMLKSE